MPSGQKHLVRCRCVLPQFKKLQDPPNHQFIVFSVMDDDGKVVPKIVQCPNCGLVHKVTDITKSEIASGKESSKAVMTIDDIRPTLPQALANVLESNNADLPTWEAVQFEHENKRWGTTFIVLGSEEEGGVRSGKYVRLLGEGLFEVKPFSREEVTSE